MKRRFASVCLAALALSACGSESSGEFTTEDGEAGEYSIDNDSGETTMTVQTPDGEVSLRSGTDVPVDLPAGFSLISGADIVSNTIIDQGETRGALVTFTSDRTPEEIADFYRAEAEDAGIEIQIETSMNGGKMIGGENETTGTTFSVSAYPDEDGTTGQLTISEEPG
jgi:hypothetical protein